MASLTHPGDSIDYENYWIVDFGCSHHATGDVKLLSNVRPHEGKRVIVIADNSLHSVMKEGNFEGKFNDCDNSKGDEVVSLKDVYHVPGLKKNLASVSQITNSGKYVLFGSNDVKIFDNLKYVDVDVLVTEKRRIHFMSYILVMCMFKRQARTRVLQFGMLGWVILDINCYNKFQQKKSSQRCSYV